MYVCISSLPASTLENQKETKSLSMTQDTGECWNQLMYEISRTYILEHLTWHDTNVFVVIIVLILISPIHMLHAQIHVRCICLTTYHFQSVFRVRFVDKFQPDLCSGVLVRVEFCFLKGEDLFILKMMTMGVEENLVILSRILVFTSISEHRMIKKIVEK